MIFRVFILAGVLLMASIPSAGAPRQIEAHVVEVSDILPIGYELAQQGREGSFTVFFFTESGKLDDKDSYEIQFSIENGRFGLDWMLLSPRNIKASEMVADFARSKGYVVEERAMNGVDYFRIEKGGSLFSLCKSVITELFSAPITSELGLYFQGIDFEME